MKHLVTQNRFSNVQHFFRQSHTQIILSRGGCVALAVAVVLVIFGIFGSEQLFGAATNNYLISLDRSVIPALNYNAVTLNVSVGNVNDIAVVEDSGTALPYNYNAATGQLLFTTNGDAVTLSLGGPDAATFGGQVTIATLRDGKKFAWSHGMDDNVFLENSITAFDNFNYRGTIYLIGQYISDTRDENWILDKIDLHQLLGKGWAIGNHTYTHGCYGVDYNNEAIAGYNRIVQTIPDSPKPNYKINSFSAPCFDSNYHPYILQHRDNGSTHVILNESGNDALIRVDPSPSNFISNGRTAKAFNVDMQIGRGNAIELGNSSEAIAIINWMSSNANDTQHFWYNTFSHSYKEVYLTTVMNHIHSNYGEAGTNTIWVAPAEEIYAYLLVRDLVNISVSNSGEPSATSTPTPAAPTATPAAPTATPAAPTATPAAPTATPFAPTATPALPTATPSNPSVTGQVLYGDSLATGWNAGKWGNVAYQLNNSSGPHVGTNSLSVQYNEAWGTMYLTSAQPISASDYDQLSFWVKAGNSGATSLRIGIMNSSYATSNRVTINNIGSTWQLVTIPLSNFGSLSDILYLLWDNPQDSSSSLFLDDIALGSSNGTVPTSTPTTVPQATATNTPTSAPQATATNTPLPTAINTPTPPSGSVSGLSVYDDSLAAGWGNGAWGNTANDVNNNSPVHAGGKSIKLQYNEAWGTYYLLSNQALDAGDYASLTFWVYGNANGSSALSVSVMNSGYQTSYKATLQNLAAGWQYVQIPLTDLGSLTDILYILLENPNTSGQPAIYIDDFILEDANATGQVAAASASFEIVTESSAPSSAINGRLTRPLIESVEDTENENNQPQDQSLFLPLLVQ